MYAYSLAQWLAFFYIYCFFGWCFESAYVSLRKHRFVNRGFMTGPYIPLYGSGAVLMLYVTMPVRGNYLLMYLLGAVGATLLEYVTGVVMERLFGVRYWDYSDQKFNFQGQICLSSTLVWGLMTVLLVEVIHQPIERAVLLIDEKILTHGTFLFTIVFTFDFAYAFRTAVDLKEMLLQAEKARKELERIQKRVEVLEAVFNESVENMVEDMNLRVTEITEERLSELAYHMEKLKSRIESSEGMERLRRAIENAEMNEHREELQSEIRQMGSRLEGLRMNVRSGINAHQLHMLNRNPSARSERYKDGWKYLKNKIECYEKDKKNH